MKELLKKFENKPPKLVKLQNCYRAFMEDRIILRLHITYEYLNQFGQSKPKTTLHMMQ